MTDPYPSYPPVVPGQPAEPFTLSTVLPPPIKPSSRPGWVIPVIAGLVVLVLVGGGVAAWALLRPAASPVATSSPTRGAPVDVVAPPAPPTKTYEEPSASDFELTIKVLRKKCFGSAGCNVTFHIALAYGGPELDPAVTYELTYQVTGAEDPLINTLEVTGDQYAAEKEERVSTASSSSKLKVTVTGISKA